VLEALNPKCVLAESVLRLVDGSLSYSYLFYYIVCGFDAAYQSTNPCFHVLLHELPEPDVAT